MDADQRSAPISGLNARKTTVQNKSANPVQITAEQLLREAVERQAEEVRVVPKQRIVDADELEEYRVRKRKEFEDSLRRGRHSIGIWMKYAEWEAAQKEFQRARSVFERALQVDPQHLGLWNKYIEMESRNKFVNAARNLFDRATTLLPRQDPFWFKYAYMEELLKNYAGARAVFERWMKWNPSGQAWMTYVHFEERCKQLDKAREVFERYLVARPGQDSFLRFCKFEERHRNIPRARAGFEKALEVIGDHELTEEFYIRFAEFEERQKEYDRVAAIYTNAISRLPESKTLSQRYLSFQKQRGSKEAVESIVTDRRRTLYEEQVAKNPYDYDAWFDLLNLEEHHGGDLERCRNTYEKAVAQIPPNRDEKIYWKRYIYLWYSYALFEECLAKDYARTREIFQRIADLIPHKKFSFAKLWLLWAEFELRQLDLDRARKVLGRGIAECHKHSIFLFYSNLELRLGCIDRCRKVLTRLVELRPLAYQSWLTFVDVEEKLNERERVRALCEVAINLEGLDKPEEVWKRYIDLEVSWKELHKAREIYERLLEKAPHFKVYKAYASFEATDCSSMENARNILKRGIEQYKLSKQNLERKFLVDHWLALERQNGDQRHINEVINMKPKAVRIRRTVRGPDGDPQGTEEVTEYIFKDDANQVNSLKILEKAKLWKQQRNASASATAGTKTD